jgi:hypothetical protein
MSSNPGLQDRGGHLAAALDSAFWLTSIPGAVEVTMQCLPGSTLLDELKRLGYA